MGCCSKRLSSNRAKRKPNMPTSPPREHIGAKRARKAVLACMLLATAFLASVAFSAGSWAGSVGKGSYISQMWKSMSSGQDFDSALEEVGAVVLSTDRVPRWMLDEVLEMDWLDGAISNQDNQVVWITKEGQMPEVRSGITSALESKGWTTVLPDASEDGLASYVKTEGECRWILAEYAQSGKETVVVMRIQRN